MSLSHVVGFGQSQKSISMNPPWISSESFQETNLCYVGQKVDQSIFKRISYKISAIVPSRKPLQCSKAPSEVPSCIYREKWAFWPRRTIPFKIKAHIFLPFTTVASGLAIGGVRLITDMNGTVHVELCVFSLSQEVESSKAQSGLVRHSVLDNVDVVAVLIFY